MNEPEKRTRDNDIFFEDLTMDWLLRPNTANAETSLPNEDVEMNEVVEKDKKVQENDEDVPPK